MDKTEFFLSEFEEIMPAASVQCAMATSDLQGIDSNAFAFSDMEILDANLATLPRGHIDALKYPQGSRDRTRFLRIYPNCPPSVN